MNVATKKSKMLVVITRRLGLLGANAIATLLLAVSFMGLVVEGSVPTFCHHSSPNQVV